MKSFPLFVCASAVLLTIAGPATAQFTITNGQTVGQQTLSSATGTVNSGGTISTSSGTVGVVINGASTLSNNGTIQQTGTGRAIDSTTASNLTVTNTGLISSVSTDAFRVNNSGSSVSLTNSGTIQVTNGGEAIDWAAISTGTNTLTNQAGGVITAVGADAVRPGQNGTIDNAGTIDATPTGTTEPSGSDGIDLRVQKNVTVTNTGTISGRHGIATDGNNVGTSSLTVINNAGGVIQAKNGSGLNVDGVNTSVTANVTNAFGATIRGGVLAAATEADGDGIDIDGVLTLNNSGDVLGLGAKGPNNAEGIAAGGGSITNTATGQIVGSTLAGDAPNGDPIRAGNGILIDDSNGGNAVAVTTVTNSGLIRGKSGFGIKIVGTFADTITNNAAGTIRGAGTGAAIQTGDGSDTITNRGAIVGDNGLAIDLEAGSDSLIVEGGSASITGDVSGGTGSNTATLNPGTGNTFSFSGSLSNFDSVEVDSGTVSFSGVSTYTGETAVTGGVLELGGANRLDSSSSLTLDGGTLRLTSINAANGQTFSAFSLDSNSSIDLNNTTSLTLGTLAGYTGGSALSITGYAFAVSPGYAIRFAGDLTMDSTFQSLASSLTINGQAPVVTFSGGFTNITPVPEPSTVYTVIGLMALIAWHARRRFVARRQRA